MRPVCYLWGSAGILQRCCFWSVLGGLSSFLPLDQSEQRTVFPLFYLFSQTTGSTRVPWLATAMEGHRRWCRLNLTWHCWVQRKHLLNLSAWGRKPSGLGWSWVVYAGFWTSLLPGWTLYGEHCPGLRLQMQPSPAVLAAFSWTGLGVYGRTLCLQMSFQVSHGLDLAATRRACIEALLGCTYFFEA